jgi:small subunit ribosomal protein S20
VAHSISAKKRIRQNVKRRAINRSRRAALRTKLRKCGGLLAKGTAQDAEGVVLDACRNLDREANRGTLHANAAARRKSRLARRLNALKQKASG